MVPRPWTTPWAADQHGPPAGRPPGLRFGHGDDAGRASTAVHLGGDHHDLRAGLGPPAGAPGRVRPPAGARDRAGSAGRALGDGGLPGLPLPGAGGRHRGGRGAGAAAAGDGLGLPAGPDARHGGRGAPALVVDQQHLRLLTGGRVSPRRPARAAGRRRPRRAAARAPRR
ncbi:hypothetical protein [Ornithinimicrobium kibberense]|uniref:hypothetical protein n=1 Tax=Ornithinimicrobium kibberense TaxID=282060 RepID=UPI003619C3EC